MKIDHGSYHRLENKGLTKEQQIHVHVEYTNRRTEQPE